MDIIIGGRQSGRTTLLIQECAANKDSVIVCPTIKMADSVYQMAKEMGVEIKHPISFRHFCSVSEGVHGGRTKYYFDNLDLCLKTMAGSADICTATVELTEPIMWLNKNPYTPESVQNTSIKLEQDVTYDEIFKDFQKTFPSFADNLKDYRPGDEPFVIFLYRDEGRSSRKYRYDYRDKTLEWV